MARRPMQPRGGARGGGRGGGRSGGRGMNFAMEEQRARQFYAQGDYPAAQRTVKAMLDRRPKDPFLLYFYGACLVQTEHYEQGAQVLERAISVPGAKLDARKPLAACHRMMGNMARAHEVLDEGLAKDPEHEVLIAGKVGLLNAENRHEEADRMLRPIIESGQYKDHNITIAWASLCKELGNYEDAVPQLEKFWKDESLPPATRVAEMFLLGEMYDKLGRYEEAWRVVSEANALRKNEHNRQEHAQSTARMISSFTKGAWERFTPAQHGVDAELPVFIVGLPRSGTTLTEQVLAAHSKVVAGGELSMLGLVINQVQHSTGIGRADMPQHPTMFTSSVLRKMGEQYIKELRRIDAEAERITDKMPMNLARLPMIPLILPGATIVRCRRRVIDVAISCWFQNFGIGAGFVYDVESLAAYVADCHKIERHCIDVLGIEMVQIEYEDMVNDLEGSARRLVDAAGLEWEPACLEYYKNVRDVRTASQDQVRKPIYKSSVERWKRYGNLINPMLEALERHGVDPYASG